MVAMVAPQSRLRRLAARFRRAHAELDYAHRRLFELRTGVSSLPSRRHAPPRMSAEDLEALFDLESSGNADLL
jgi:hypothetical protein